MANPFSTRTPALSGPATDIMPVTPDDNSDLPEAAIALYVESAGSVSFVTIKGATRSVTVSSNFMLPVGVTRVNATGTSATGIHAMVLA